MDVNEQGPAQSCSNPVSLCFARMLILSARCESERAVHLVLCSEGGGFLGLEKGCLLSKVTVTRMTLQFVQNS